VKIGLRASVVVFCLLGLIPASAQDISLEQVLTKEEFATLGVSNMSPPQRAALSKLLGRTYRQGFLVGQSKVSTANSVIGPPTRSAVETQIDGEFNGWEGETIVKLMNGQIWEQTEYHYEYLYAFMPKVLIYSSDGTYKMMVVGASRAVGVRQLR